MFLDIVNCGMPFGKIFILYHLFFELVYNKNVWYKYRKFTTYYIQNTPLSWSKKSLQNKSEISDIWLIL